MRARLFCPVGDLSVDHTFETEAVLGRSPNCTLELPSNVLSALHARIQWDAERGGYMLEDLGSSNGTRLDGERVEEPRALGHLHVITLAEMHDLVFQDLERCAARHAAGGEADEAYGNTAIHVLNLPLPGELQGGTGQREEQEKTVLQRLNLPLPGLLRQRPAEETPAPSSAARPPARPAPAKPTMAPVSVSSPEDLESSSPSRVFTRSPVSSGGAPQPVAPPWWIEASATGEEPAARHLLRPGENIVGRNLDADVIIRSPEVSRRHACLDLRGGRLFVRDLGSRNQTFVEDSAITVEVELRPGQHLRFGALKCQVVSGHDPASGGES